MAVTKWGSAVTATTMRKNSGILRYQIGGNNPGGNAINGGDGRVVHCLGDDALTTPDMDNQLFGNTVGYPAIVAPVNSIFASLGTPGIVAANQAEAGDEAGIRFPPNSPNSGTATGQARLQAAGRIPAGTKVMAWYEPMVIAQGGSTTPDETPMVTTQVEYIYNVPYLAGVAQTGLPKYLTSLRVGIYNNGFAGATTATQGILYVWIMHSLLDIPGLTVNAFDQSIIPSILG